MLQYDFCMENISILIYLLWLIMMCMSLKLWFIHDMVHGHDVFVLILKCSS